MPRSELDGCDGFDVKNFAGISHCTGSVDATIPNVPRSSGLVVNTHAL